MNKNKLYIILAIIILLSIGITQILYSYYKSPHVFYMNYTFLVGDALGLTIDTDALHMGRMTPGGASARNVEITNTFGYRTNVRISLHGDKTEWMSVSETEFMLEKNSNKTIGFAVSPPKDVSHGNYSGYIMIEFERG